MPNDNKYDRHVWTYRVLGSDESEVDVSHYCTAAELRERINEELDIPGTYGVDYLDFTDMGLDGGFVRRQRIAPREDNSMDRKAADRFASYGYGIVAVRFENMDGTFSTKFWQEEHEEEATEFAIENGAEPFDWATGERL